MEIENLKTDNEELQTENVGLKEANEDLEKMVDDEIYCRQARVQLGLGAGDRRT